MRPLHRSLHSRHGDDDGIQAKRCMEVFVMRALFAVLTLIVCCAASSLATAWWLNPVQELNETQAAVMQEHLAAFCTKDDRHDKQYRYLRGAVAHRYEGQSWNGCASRIRQVQGHKLRRAGTSARDQSNHAVRAADAVHSRTSYSKATPSGSFSSNHLSAASRLANTLT